MATDYISTNAWDNPLNPWPFSATVVVSGVNIPLATLTLVNFNPNAADDEGAIQYTNGGTFLEFNNNQGWYYGNGSFSFFLATNSRSIPNKSAGAGLSAGWIRYSNTGNVDMFSITAVVDNLTDWTKRRLWNLNG
jgi:hypothetical protein